MISDEARAYDITADAMLPLLGEVDTAHSKYKALKAVYLRKWRQVYQRHLTQIQEEKHYV